MKYSDFYDEEDVINDLAYLKNFMTHCWLDDPKELYATVNPEDIDRCKKILLFWVKNSYYEIEPIGIHQCYFYIDQTIAELEYILRGKYNNKMKFD